MSGNWDLASHAAQPKQTKKNTKESFPYLLMFKKSLNSMSSYESLFFDCPTHLLSPFRSEAWVLEFWKHGLYNLFNNSLPSIFLGFFFLLELSKYYTSWIYFTRKNWTFIFSFLFYVFLSFCSTFWKVPWLIFQMIYYWLYNFCNCLFKF